MALLRAQLADSLLEGFAHNPPPAPLVLRTELTRLFYVILGPAVPIRGLYGT